MSGSGLWFVFMLRSEGSPRSTSRRGHSVGASLAKSRTVRYISREMISIVGIFSDLEAVRTRYPLLRTSYLIYKIESHLSLLYWRTTILYLDSYILYMILLAKTLESSVLVRLVYKPSLPCLRGPALGLSTSHSVQQHGPRHSTITHQECRWQGA